MNPQADNHVARPAPEPLLFAGGPLRALLAAAGLARRKRPQTLYLAVSVVLLGWVPLASGRPATAPG